MDWITLRVCCSGGKENKTHATLILCRNMLEMQEKGVFVVHKDNCGQQYPSKFKAGVSCLSWYLWLQFSLPCFLSLPLIMVWETCDTGRSNVQTENSSYCYCCWNCFLKQETAGFPLWSSFDPFLGLTLGVKMKISFFTTVISLFKFTLYTHSVLASNEWAMNRSEDGEETQGMMKSWV